MTKSIYIALSTFAQEGQQPLVILKNSGLSFDINATGKRLSKEQVMSALKDYHGVVAGLEPYDADILKALPDLQCISRCGVGIDNVDLAVAQERGIAVLNTPEVVVTPVAEMTLALIFDCLRQITAQTVLMREGKWERLVGRQLKGKTVGVIGLGRIGKRVAFLLKSLGADVVACDMNIDEPWIKQHNIIEVGIQELLRQSDIITLHLAGPKDHPFRLAKEQFATMKKGALLINTSRGQFIHEQDLYQALVNNHLGGAGLDVFEQEPYQGPLTKLPNVIVTPHCSTLTNESRLEMEIEAVNNIVAFFKSRG